MYLHLYQLPQCSWKTTDVGDCTQEATLTTYGILHNAAATASADGECMNIHTQEREHNVSVHPVCTSKVRLCVEEAGLQTHLLEIAGFLNCLISARGARNGILAAKFLSKTMYIHVYFLLLGGHLNPRQFGFSPHCGGVALPGTTSLLFSLPQPTSSDTM